MSVWGCERERADSGRVQTGEGREAAERWKQRNRKVGRERERQ